jgi:predicted enzyme related to lactoylglutathione lyase
MASFIPGTIGWIDLTIPEAEEVRDFYTAVAGWRAAPVSMGGYVDYAMHPAGDGEPVAGICHARGVNTGLPRQWLVYITVTDLDGALQACLARGGAILRDPTGMGEMGRFAVIRDPAGAVAALFEPAR